MPLENWIQDGIHSIEEGAGAVVLRTALCVFVAFGIFSLYAWRQFRGLNDPAAMECAQLARSLSEGRGFTTRCVRPADLTFPGRHGGPPAPVSRFPDLRQAPLFPAVLSLAFLALRPSFEVRSDLALFGPEKTVILPLGIGFSVAAGFLIFLLGKRLFGDWRVAGVAATVYFLSDAVLAWSLSGRPTSLLVFLATAAFYAAVLAVQHRNAGRPLMAWLLPLAGAAVLCGLAFLTDYSAVVLAPALAVFLGLTLDRERWPVVLGFVIVFLLVASPWLARNRHVSGAVLGAAPYAALNETRLYEADAYDRTLEPTVSRGRAMRALKAKLTTHLFRAVDRDLRLAGGGFIFCFFVVALFHRFDGDDANRLRAGVAVGMALLLGLAALRRADDARGAFDVFLPLIALYGTAFFFAMLDRSEFFDVSWPLVLTWLFILLMAAPAAFRLIGPAARIPYPPYFPPFIAFAADQLGPDDVLCTDIPWATAWYGGRTSILLPRSVDEFREIHDQHTPIGALYLTTETGDRPYTGALVEGAYRSWLPVLNGAVPADFPLRHGIALPPGGRDQLLLMDRPPGQETSAETSVEPDASGFSDKPSVPGP